MAIEINLHEDEKRRVRDKRLYDEVMEIFNDPRLEQTKTLADILSRNAKTEYLLKYKLDGATDVKSFKEKVPLSEYDDFKPFVDRIIKGEKAPLLAVDPVVEIWTSSGTSKGVPKMFAVTDEDIARRAQRSREHTAIMNRLMPQVGTLKSLDLRIIRASTVFAGGFPCHPVTTAAFSSPYFGDVWRKKYNTTSPPEVTLSQDSAAGMYCHLLLGLAQRDKIGRIACSFPTVFIRAMRCLEEWWPDLCDDIANGSLSPRVKDEKLRSVVLSNFEKDSSLAELLRKDFSAKECWKATVPKLFPNAKMIDMICTGSMEAYFPMVKTYTGNLPVINSGSYGSTEVSFGLNLKPWIPAHQTTYTLFPHTAYFEFISVPDSNGVEPGSDDGEVLDLMSLKEGEEYEILVTTVAGLYRYRVGDILKVVGFYKSNPTFQLMRRKHVVLSVDTDKTDENELQTAVKKASQILERELGLRILDYTSSVDYASKPGHYVIFWELDSSSASLAEQSSTKSVLEKCSAVMEAELGRIYRRGRHDGIIGALELRIVREGSFDLLLSDAVARGASASQFKTPRGMAAESPGLGILNGRVTQSVASQEKPPFHPGRIESLTSS